MGTKEINIKNRTYYFYNIIDLDKFDESKIKADKKYFNDIDIYYLGYEYKKKITECNVIIRSANPLYLRIVDIKGQFEKGKDDAWYLLISDKDDVYKKLVDTFESIKNEITEKT